MRTTSFRHRAAIAAAFSVGILGARAANAQTFGYCGFADAGALTLNGSAKATATALSLTSTGVWTAGSAFDTAPITWASTTSFSTSFSFELTPSQTHGEGISFIIQSDGLDALGGAGGGIGYGITDDPLGTGITSSVEIEFDTYLDPWDPDANHVALTLDGDDTTHIAYASPSFTMLNGGVLYAWIDYDATSTTLDVYLAQAATKPATPLLTTTADIGSMVGPEAFVGFTGSTGSQENEQDVHEWEFSTLGEPCVCGGNADCSGATPVCDTVSQICGVPVAPVDAGPADTGAPQDASVVDSSMMIAEDSSIPDSSEPFDSGAPKPPVDSGAVVRDSGTPPAAPDASMPAPPVKSSPIVTEAGDLAGSACSCRAAGAGASSRGALFALLGLGLAWTSRRRRYGRRA